MTDDLVKRLREEQNYQDDPVLEAADALEAQAARIAALEAALHSISLASQNSMSSKYECGRIARAAMEGKDD